MRSRSCLIVVLGAAALLSSVAIPAGAANRPPDAGESVILASSDHVVVTAKGGWILYDFSDEVKFSESRSYSGTSDGSSGCVFTGQEAFVPESSTRGMTVHEREVATDLAHCVMVTERWMDENPDVAPEPLASEEVDTVGSSPDYSTAAASRSAWHRTRYEDIAGLEVNWSRVHVSWTYTGTCVTSSWGHYTDYWWQGLTGWVKASSSTTSGRSCAEARTTSNSLFVNYPFCVPTMATFTSFTPNEVRGRYNGAYIMNWSASKSGDCSSLLYFYRTHGYS